MFEFYQSKPSWCERLSDRLKPRYVRGKSRVTATCKKYPLPVVCTTIVTTEILAALCIREGGWFFALLHRHGLPSIENYAAKWEFFALSAALLLLAVYIIFLVQAREDFPAPRGRYYFGALLVLTFGLAALWHAVTSLETTVDSHVFAVLLVSGLFSLGDFFTWKGVDPQKQNKKQVAWSYLFFADLPVLAGLTILAFYHWFSHDDDKGHENLAHYFMAGGIAFQWLASNVVFLIITWKDSLESRATAPTSTTAPATG